MKTYKGFIFGPNKIPKKGDALLWVIGDRVINGEWHLKVSADNLTAVVPYTGQTVYNLRAAPYEMGHDYNDVLKRVEATLGNQTY
jgi:hypothetical protein